MIMQRFYRFLERNTPPGVKNIIPEEWRIWLGYEIKVKRGSIKFDNRYLVHPLTLPHGQTEDSLRRLLESYGPEDGFGKAELRAYLNEAFRRFLYTLQLIPDNTGKLLEIGANPYYMTHLLRKFRRYEYTATNYFGAGHEHVTEQNIVSAAEKLVFEFTNINIERDSLPFADDTFDVVLLCEVLEHFTNDPMKALLQLKRVLKPEGYLILTTPNVARLVNVAKLIAGNNLYDPYSGYGPYGRHNREYNRHEVVTFLEYLGFTIDVIFTSDVHPNDTPYYGDPEHVYELVQHRKDDLGQYIFIRAINGSKHSIPHKKPIWLYRNYPPEELSDK